MAAATPWWAPHVHADRRPFLLGRARITAALRAFFAARDFIEVEAAILQVSPGNEAHLHAFATELVTPAAPEQSRNVAPPGDRDALAAQAAAAGVRCAADDSWSDIFSRVLVERIEPHLGIGRATILDEYPAVEAALARPKQSDPRVAERFELYVCGVEIANAFGELTDAAEQRRRFDAEMAEKQLRYGERYPVDEDFLAALGRMPPACGSALGVDRLVMLATGATQI